jgi:hypothetical protein
MKNKKLLLRVSQGLAALLAAGTLASCAVYTTPYYGSSYYYPSYSYGYGYYPHRYYGYGYSPYRSYSGYRCYNWPYCGRYYGTGASVNVGFGI